MKSNYLLITAIILQITILAQVPNTWNSKGIGGGGALFSPSINPADHDEIYIASDMSELFHSSDKGKSWAVIPYQDITGGHDACVQFTVNTAIHYVVDYTSVAGSDYIRPMKTMDGGGSWSVLPGNPYPLEPNAGVLRLFADYHNPDHLVIADYGTIYFSGDGGATFHKIHDCLSNGAGNHIAGVFFDGADIFIGTNDGLLVSANSGSTFTTMTATGIPSTEYILSFAGAKQGGVRRFYCLTANNVWAGYQYGSNYWNAMKGVYRMENNDGTWIKQVGGIASGTDFPVFIGMAEDRTDIAYISGGASGGYPIVMKSVNAGNWNHVFLTNNNQNIYTGWAGYGGDHGWGFPEAPFGFTVALNDANTVVMTDYSCAHITSDAGATWHQQYLSLADENPMGSPTPIGKKYHGNGIENASCWQIVWRDSLNLLAGFSDINGIMSDNKGESWKFIPGLTQNTVYRLAIHPNGKIYAASSNVHDMFQSTRIYDAQIDAGTGAIYVSSDNGTSFSLLHNFNHPVVWIAIDANNPERMYASVLHSNKNLIGGIWVTNNLSAGTGATWTKMATPPRSNGHPFNITVLNNGDLVASFSARKPKSSTAFTDSSGVYYYSSASSTWYDRSDPNMHFWTQDVVVDPNDIAENTWYASVFTGWGTPGISGTGGLFKTTDKGLTWTRVNDNFRINSCSINPSNPDELYFTTEIDGLWHCANATSNSPSFSQVQSYPFRHPVRVHFRPTKLSEIWVTSFGNGIRVGSNNSPSGINFRDHLKTDRASIFPNPFRTSLQIEIKDYHQGEEYKIFLTDITGREFYHAPLSKQTTLTFGEKNPDPGIYFYRITESGNTLQTGKLLKD
ncbi:MAG: T9SS type A sorting domain-containing protein [Bacteroidota bacterium]